MRCKCILYCSCTACTVTSAAVDDMAEITEHNLVYFRSGGSFLEEVEVETQSTYTTRK